MTLSKRALIVVFPVVLLSNLLVAFSVYLIQRASIVELETTRLSHQMSGLEASFKAELHFNRDMVFSIRNGSAVRSFVREGDPAMRATGLGVRIQDSLQFFAGRKDRFVSFAIVDPDGKVAYYFENSDDPFAEIQPAQLAVAKRLTAGSALATDEYVPDASGGLIIHSELVDETTFETPLATQKEFAFVVQSAVRPKTFADMKAALEREYRTEIRLGPARPASNGIFSYSASPIPGLQLAITLGEDFVEGRLVSLKRTLGIGSVGLSLLSVGLLLFLVRRTITGPIAKLDRQVTEVFEGRREQLEARDASDEIGRLSVNIAALHDRAVRSFQEIQRMSWTDSLTGISNRPHFHLLGTAWMSTAQRAGDRLGLLFVDLDNFKFVNDTYGHAAGDAVLKAFTARAAETLGRHDAGAARRPLLARLSGDEFAILLPGGRERAAEVAASIIEAFAGGLEADGTWYPVGASIGIASFPEDAASFEDLISRADDAMYEAKAAGKNGFAIYSGKAERRDRRAEDRRA